MPGENVLTMKRAYDAFEQDDMETALVLIDPEFRLEDRIMPESDTELRGPEALLANASRVREVFGDVRWRPVESIDLGDRLLVRINVVGTAQHTGLALEGDIAHLWTLRHGRITRLQIFRTWDEARAAAGLEG